MTIEKKVIAINKKHESDAQVPMPVPQTVLTYVDYRGTNDLADNASTVYLNCSTLKRSNAGMYHVVDETKRIKHIDADMQRDKVVKGYCFSYDEDLDMIIAFIGAINISLPMTEDRSAEWEERCRFYVDRDKNVYSMLDDGSYGLVDWHNDDIVFWFIHLSEMAYINPCSSAGSKSNMPDFEPVWRVFPKVVTRDEGDSVILATKHDFFSYLDQSIRCNEELPEYDPDGLLTYSLLDKQVYADDAMEAVKKIAKSNPDIMKKYAGYYEDYTNYAKFFVMERVPCKDPVACIRAFVLTKGPEMHEIHRFYFTREEMLFYKSDNMGSFVAAPVFYKRKYWAGINLVGYNKKIAQGTVIERLDGILESVADNGKGLYIWAMLHAPIMEKLWKAGYSEYVSFMLNMLGQDSPEWAVQKSCGMINKKKHSIYGMLGMNKHQTDVLLNKMVETGDHLLAANVKSVLYGTMYRVSSVPLPPVAMIDVSISDIDHNSFDSVMELFDEMYHMTAEYKDTTSFVPRKIIQGIIGCAVKISSTWGVKTLIRSKKSLMLVCRTVFEQSRINGMPENKSFASPLDKIQQYTDYLHMIKDDETGRFKPYFNSISELPLLHDEASASYKIRQDAEMAEKVKKAVERVEKFSYENNTYRVITPTCVDDFAREGDKLGHCVGSYFDRVADGETNIMFIRKKSAPDKPFFTVEISDGGYIEQIHGFSNRNLDTEPDLIPFIREWQEKRGVILNNIDKIR